MHMCSVWGWGMPRLHERNLANQIGSSRFRLQAFAKLSLQLATDSFLLFGPQKRRKVRTQACIHLCPLHHVVQSFLRIANLSTREAFDESFGLPSCLNASRFLFGPALNSESSTAERKRARPPARGFARVLSKRTPSTHHFSILRAPSARVSVRAVGALNHINII